MATLGPKDLPAVNDALTLDIPTDQAAIAGVQYISGAGTLVLEGSIDKATWVSIGLTPAAGGAAVTTITAVGLWWADVSFCEIVRVRKSVGTAACVAALTVTKRG